MEKLDKNIGDKWDSGKVLSERSVNVPYQGTALSSGEKCFWKVCVWDGSGQLSEWSKSATFEMGLLKESDWQGQWIGKGEAGKVSDYIPGKFGQALRLNGISGTVKIQHYEGLKPPKEITISAWIKPDDSLSDRWQEIYRKEDGNARCLLAYGKTGDKTGVWFGLVIGGRYTEDCGPLALEQVKDGRWHLVMATYDGSNKQIYFDGHEICRQAVRGPIDTAGRRAAFIGSNDGHSEFFPGAIDDVRMYNRSLSAADVRALATGEEVGPDPVGRWRFEGNLTNDVSGKDGDQAVIESLNAPLLRKEFTLAGQIRKARIYVSGLGWHELYVNGMRVGDNVLDPATTDYAKRVLYITHDVTPLLKAGKNVIAAMLGNGWFCEPGTLKYGDSPRLLLQMNIEYANGTRESIVSDLSWKTADGPITYNDLWHGETYDARQEKEGWTQAGYDDSNWIPAQLKTSPGGRMVSQIMPAIKVNKTIRPVKLTHSKPDIYVFDLGQLFGGWASLNMRGPAGSKVTIKYSDRLSIDSGLVDDHWITLRPHGNETDYYILKGDPQGERYEPRFTYHPVRYVQITGYPGEPTLDDLEGRVVYSAIDMSGDFDCSNPLLNQIHHNVIWTFTNGLFGIPLDCLHREHWAWTDPATVTGTLYPRRYMPLFWLKWTNDIKDAQLPNGAVPDICPSYFRELSDPAWGGNYPILLWYLYQYYDDIRFLEEHYEGMKRWLAHLAIIADNHIIVKGRYGDHMLPGLKPGDEQFISEETPPPLVWTGYYYRDAFLVSKIAAILGREDDARQYADLAESIRNAFNRKWLDTDRNIYATGAQTAGFFALALDIVPSVNRKQVLVNLVKDIGERYRFHHHTGNTGTTCMIDVLAANGYGDIMYLIATQTTYPGWGYMVSQGATTIWENWGREGGEDSMVMWLTIDEFFYNGLAGIKGPNYYGHEVMSPGFRQIEIKPQVLGDLTYAKASMNTVQGGIASSWKKGDNSLRLEVVIPVNSTARVFVPKIGLHNVHVTEGGQTAWKDQRFVNGIEGIKGGYETEDYVTFETGSGVYAFELIGQL